MLDDFFDMLNLSFEQNQVACAILLVVRNAFDNVCHQFFLNSFRN